MAIYTRALLVCDGAAPRNGATAPWFCDKKLRVLLSHNGLLVSTLVDQEWQEQIDGWTFRMVSGQSLLHGRHLCADCARAALDSDTAAGAGPFLGGG